jgi:2-dehydro-3-deoxy-L-rhamnonate dehydrogenase (NAD+)
MTANTVRYDFDGRVGVVTGGANGIGRAVAERMLDAGARVAVWDLDVTPVQPLAGERLVVLPVDIADPDATSNAAQQTVEAFGGIDMLVNSAGIAGPNARLWEYDPEAWRKVMTIDLYGTFSVCRACIPALLRSKSGRIVNIASIAGKEGNPNASAYSAAKAGVVALTKSLGKELAGTGVLANVITPAAVRTAIFDQMKEEHIQFMLSKIPLGRFGTVDEIAAMCMWLSSEECSFATGAVFDVSGGRAVY